MDIYAEDETSYATQCEEAILKYEENKSSAKHQHVPFNNHKSLPTSYLVPIATAPGFYQPSFDPYDLSSDDEEYLTHNNVAETTPGQSDRRLR